MISDFHLAISAIYRQKDQTIENGALHLITRNSLTYAIAGLKEFKFKTKVIALKIKTNVL